MKGVHVFLAEGFEEIEALATVDVLRRAGIDVKTVSITHDRTVKGAHGIPVVADWNREVLSKQPDYIVPQHGRAWDEKTRSYYERKPKKLSEFSWWPYYSDLHMTPEAIRKVMRETTGDKYWEYRYIGIDISCYNDQNAKLPYPIKIASVPDVSYSELPPSNGDPNQGFRDDEDD